MRHYLHSSCRDLFILTTFSPLNASFPNLVGPPNPQYHFRCGMVVDHDNHIPSALPLLLWQLVTSSYYKKNTIYCAEMTQKLAIPIRINR